MKWFCRNISVAAALLFFLSSHASADIKLPAPQTEGGMGLFQALKERSSAPGGDFPTAPLSMEDLSTILWSATGLNRGEKGWTVPMAHGLPPYVYICAALESGVYRYDWAANALVEISKEDIRGKIGAQRFVASASCSLIFISSAEGLVDVKDEDLKKHFASVAAGAMTQDVYLAAAALNVGARYIHSIKFPETRSLIGIPDEDEILCLMILGK
ncbi:MAG: nitroreductase family protein [Synergistaceae bacterium]|nr:nitroreductase family protein [Synergistaceae bacterium]